ncbi:MAG: baseplate J/gp47 family protein [Sulfuriferula sp.]
MIPYSRPDYLALMARIESDLAAVPASLRAPLSAMWSRVTSGMHSHLDWVDAQCSPLTCELERLYDWAALYGVSRLLASASTGNVIAKGNVGAKLLAGALLRGSNGLDYKVLAATTLLAGNTIVAVRCTTASAASNLAAGLQLALIDPVIGVNNTLTVDGASLGGGADDELLADWRARVATEWMQVVTNGARSGKPDDYRFWARSAHQSVSGEIVQLHVLGTGTVVVRPICNNLANRLPTQAVLDAVSLLFARTVPAVSDWRVTAPVVHPISFTIHLQPAVDTAANRLSITNALKALILTKGADGVLTLLWSEVDATVAMTTALYVLDESIAITWLPNEVPVFGAIIWN